MKNKLYILKQTTWVWYQTILDIIRKLDFYKTEVNHQLFVFADKTIFIAVYVDDLLLFDADIDLHMDNVMGNFWVRFQMTDLGDISYHLWM